jgi:hypothetical protein
MEGVAGGRHAQAGGTVDDKSILLNTRVLEGSVADSVCTSVTTPSLEVEGCLLMNVTAKKVVGKNCIVYNVVDDSEEGLVLPEGTVLTNVFMPGQPKLVMQSTIDTDGGKVFKTKLDANPYSFNEVYGLNGGVDVTEATAAMAAASKALADTMMPESASKGELPPPAKRHRDQCAPSTCNLA